MSTPELVIKLINESNNKNYKFKTTDVDVLAPQLDITTSRNTIVQLNAKPGSGFSGSIAVHYSRESVGNMGLPTQLMSEVTFTVASILAKLNEKLLIPVSLNDISPIVLPVMEVGDILTLTVGARSDSLAWIGAMQISLLYGVPPEIGDIWDITSVFLPNEI